MADQRVSLAALEAQDRLALGQPGQPNRIDELVAASVEVRLCHPPGDGAGPSDVDADLGLGGRLHQLFQGREPNGVDGGIDGLFHE